MQPLLEGVQRLGHVAHATAVQEHLEDDVLGDAAQDQREGNRDAQHLAGVANHGVDARGGATLARRDGAHQRIDVG
jgi:hypothetical protein